MSHYFDDEPETRSAPTTIRVDAGGVDFELQTDRGTFSHGRLDAGTRMLLDAAPAPPATGRLVDVGCGAGPMALSLAMHSPGAEIVAVDTNRRALELCRANADRLGIGNIVVCHPDDYPDDRRIVGIWSNPPIRIGKEALHELLVTWLSRLADDGDAWWVVHKHLGADSLQRWLTGSGWPTERAASSKGYRLLRSRPQVST